MGKKSKIAIGVVLLAGLVSVFAFSAAKRGNKAVEVRIEAVQKRDLIASVTASGQVRPQTKVDVALRRQRQDHQAGRERRPDGEGRPAPPANRSDAGTGGRRARRRRCSRRAARSSRRHSPVSTRPRRATIDRPRSRRQTRSSFPTSSSSSSRPPSTWTARWPTRARHGVDQAIASVNDSKSSLDKTTIFAPMSGQVTRLAVEQGETAVPGTFSKDQALLLTISDMSVLETRVKVDETDVARISVGDSAQVQLDAFPDTTFLGRVTRISNSSVKAARRHDDDRPGSRLRGHDPASERPQGHPPGLLGDRQGDHGQEDARAVGADHRPHGAREPDDPAG